MTGVEQAKHIRRGRLGQARAALTSGLILFVAGQALLGVLVDGPLRIVRDPLYAIRLGVLRQKLAGAPWVGEGHQSPSSGSPKLRCVLFLGTSRSEFGVQTAVLDSQLSRELHEPVVTSNWGGSGWALFRMLLCWSRLERDGIRPDLVFVEVMPFYLAEGYGIDSSPLGVPAFQLDAADVAFVGSHDPSRTDLWEGWLISHAVPVHAHRETLLQLIWPDLTRPLKRSFADLGRDRRQSSAPGSAAILTEMQRKAFAPVLANFRVGERECKVLEELLGRLREAGVPAALLVMPEAWVHRCWYSPTGWKEIDAYLQQVSREFGVPLINARTWMDHPDDFFDAHHLTDDGADRFSERLGREVIVPLLRRSPQGASGTTVRLPSDRGENVAKQR